MDADIMTAIWPYLCPSLFSLILLPEPPLHPPPLAHLKPLVPNAKTTDKYLHGNASNYDCHCLVIIFCANASDNQTVIHVRWLLCSFYHSAFNLVWIDLAPFSLGVNWRLAHIAFGLNAAKSSPDTASDSAGICDLTIQLDLWQLIYHQHTMLHKISGHLGESSLSLGACPRVSDGTFTEQFISYTLKFFPSCFPSPLCLLWLAWIRQLRKYHPRPTGLEYRGSKPRWPAWLVDCSG